MRLSQFAEQYCLLRPHQSLKHRADIHRTVRRFVEANGDLVVYEIREIHIAKFLGALGERCRSSHSIKHYLAVLKAILNEAFQQGVRGRLPRFPKIRVEKRTPDAWSVEEIRLLFEFVKRLEGDVGLIPARLWWESLLLAAYYTGLRISGLLNIFWFQVDLEGGFLRALTPKTSKEQVFALPRDLVNLLRLIEKPLRAKVWEHPYHDKWPFRALRRIVDRAGIPAPRSMHGQLFQKMRRTCITWTAVHDLSLATRIAGHASPETTVKHYVDPRMLGAIRPVVPPIELKTG